MSDATSADIRFKRINIGKCNFASLIELEMLKNLPITFKFEPRETQLGLVIKVMPSKSDLSLV